MAAISIFLTALLNLAATVLTGAHYPTIPDDLLTPTQQRLAVIDVNSVSVGWNTYVHLSKPCVQYGLRDDDLTQIACSMNSITYPTSRTWFNSVTLAGLKPATTYFYKIVSTNSRVEHFFSPRLVGDKTPFTMNAVIDLGVYGRDGYTIKDDHSKRDTIPDIEPALNHTTIGRLAQTIDHYELVMHPGDLAYADNWYKEISNLFDSTNAYEAILENFYNQLAPVAGRKLYMTSPGNHEAACQEIPFTTKLCHDGQKNFSDFIVRFSNTMPTAFLSTSNSDTARTNANLAKVLAFPPMWYSFEYGMVHVTMMDTETDYDEAVDGPDGSAHLNAGPFARASQQLEFLAADLASVDRSITPWLIVGGHRPWYTTDESKNKCDVCQKAFEELLYKYGVDLAVFGHVHNGQRHAPTFKGKVDANDMKDPKAPMYIVAGGAGNIEGLRKVGKKPEYNRWAYDDDYTYATLTFKDEQNLQVDFIRSSTGEVLDSSTLYKSHSVQFVVQTF